MGAAPTTLNLTLRALRAAADGFRPLRASVPRKPQLTQYMFLILAPSFVGIGARVDSLCILPGLPCVHSLFT